MLWIYSMEEKSIEIYIDESGSFHDENNSHFVIGGLLFSSEHSKFVRAKYRLQVKNHFKKYKIMNVSNELKSTSIKSKHLNRQIDIIENISEDLDSIGAKMFALIVDIKKHKEFSNLNNKRNNENLRYNYFVKHLLLELINSKVIDFDSEYSINLCCDFRHDNVGKALKLEDYLELEITNKVQLLTTINVSYINSCRNYITQLSDMVAGLKFKQYNRESKINMFCQMRLRTFNKIYEWFF